MFINREIKLPDNHHFFLFGPRQTGKSTLLNQLFEGNAVFFNLLDNELYRKLLANPEIFKKEVLSIIENSTKKYIIVDEVQKVPALLDEIHYLIESNIDKIFILSGSSSRKLKRFQANMLAGRAWTYNLAPLTYRELDEKFDLMKIMRYGSLPPVFKMDSDLEIQEFLRSYVNTYLQDEIELEANIRNLSGFLRFLPIAASQNGELLNYSNIARETQVSYKTVREYYKILEDTLIGFYLMPYSKSIRKKLNKHSKFYFFDLGVVTAINKNLRNSLNPLSYEYGKIFEHFIILEIFRLNNYFKLDLNISFYRTESGAEVDCIIESPVGKKLAIEIKSTANPDKKMLKGIYSFREKVPEAIGILACRIKKPQKINDILILPWQKTLELIKEEA